MRDPRTARRYTAAGAMLLQLLVAGLLPVFVSAHEAAELPQVVHIEQEGGSPSCPRSHNHYQCATCRLLAAAFFFSPECRSSELDTVVRLAPPVRSDEMLPRHVRPSSLGSRAPPLA